MAACSRSIVPSRTWERTSTRWRTRRVIERIIGMSFHATDRDKVAGRLPRTESLAVHRGTASGLTTPHRGTRLPVSAHMWYLLLICAEGTDRGGAVEANRAGPGDARLMVRVAQMHYRSQLSQAQIGERIGMSRYQVGRMLERGAARGTVGIEIVHPDARLMDLEASLEDRFGLRDAVVVDVPMSASEQATQELAREAVASAAARVPRASSVRPGRSASRGAARCSSSLASFARVGRRPPRSSSSMARPRVRRCRRAPTRSPSGSGLRPAPRSASCPRQPSSAAPSCGSRSRRTA